MRRSPTPILLLILVAVAIGLVFAFPRINNVETGKTPQYPDLKLRSYDVAPQKVYALLREIAETSPGWKLSGHGFGPGSWSVQAVRILNVPPSKYDVHVKITRQGAQALVSVRSTSQWGKWDFGQNARNIREILRLLDEKLGA
jgi:hypothetical protein